MYYKVAKIPCLLLTLFNDGVSCDEVLPDSTPLAHSAEKASFNKQTRLNDGSKEMYWVKPQNSDVKLAGRLFNVAVSPTAHWLSAQGRV